MIAGEDLIHDLLIVSEKAASIARICRQNDHLLSLLIQEKSATEKNARFVTDFKTLADVLVQEMIRYELETKYPDLKGFIYGEESNTFTNTLGESVTVTLNETKSDSLLLLTKILDGDDKAAECLADCIHSTMIIDDVPVHSLPTNIPAVALKELAMWIDPIGTVRIILHYAETFDDWLHYSNHHFSHFLDSTAEYINGGRNNSEVISLNGLNCVTVLIGLFNRSTGKPVIGIMNQPFYSCADGQRWLGRCFWGLSVEDLCQTSASSSEIQRTKPLIAVSSSESDQNRKKLEKAGFDLISPAGAGYKILCVILNIVDAYVLSQGTTYFWDTCGCHAIMNALKGKIWNYQAALNGSLTEISYRGKCDSCNIEQYSNKCGIIACKDDQLTQRIVSILQ